MFRALLPFQPGQKTTRFEAPLSVTLIDNKNAEPVELHLEHEAIFTTAVGHGSKRTLASWHVTTPQEIVEHMLDLVKMSIVNGCDDGAKL
jgi:trehalose 6-phosphate synthase/phosphatase